MIERFNIPIQSSNISIPTYAQVVSDYDSSPLLAHSIDFPFLPPPPPSTSSPSSQESLTTPTTTIII